MSQSILRYQYTLIFFFIRINFIFGQICQTDNNIPDFFYNMDFTGPIFDQPVYTKYNLPISTPINQPILNFSIRPQTNYTRPSFNAAIIQTRALSTESVNITITTSDSTFDILHINDYNYSLIIKNSPLNYFSPFNRYLFKLIAKQTFINSYRPSVISTAIVQINLVNYNAHSPIFIPDNPIFYISEGAEPNTIFGTVYAHDADNDQITYSITSSSQFLINSSTGVLRLAQRLDSLTLSEYFVDVTATDDRSSCQPADTSCKTHSNSTQIKIIVTEINRNAPKFLNEACGKNIPLNESSQITDVLLLTVLDDDRGENGYINILFPSEESRTTASGLTNTAYSQFRLEQLNQTNNNRTAILKNNEIFDYDRPGATRVWYLLILATDAGKPQRQSFCSLRINLIDINDNPPIFMMTNWNYTIYRSSLNVSNPQFLRVIASDADSDFNGMIDYYISTSNVPYFAINRTTGTIILRNEIRNLSDIDFNRFPIIFNVYAQDRGSPSLISRNNATITINYSDRNESPPARWLNSNYEDLNIVLQEKFYEMSPHQPIYDTNGFNGSIFYELSSDISSIMTVSSPFFLNTELPFRDSRVEKYGRIFKSGIILTNSLHAEIQDIYCLYIRVLVNPPLIGKITIRLKDENDQIPTFDIRSIVLSVMEKENGTRTIAQIQAFDRDINETNNQIFYRVNTDLTDSITKQIFHVGIDGTISTNTIFGIENNQTLHRLFITAYNNQPAWNSNTIFEQDFQFDIQVISINDQGPVINNNNNTKIENRTIDETTKIGTNILELKIIDPDIDTKLNLGILNGNIRNIFTFTLLSTNADNLTRTQFEAIGQLKLIGTLDCQLISNYTLILFASDTKNLETTTVNIHIKPQNTKAPYFKLISENTPYEYQVIENLSYLELNELNGHRIEAIDPDPLSNQSQLYYEIYDPRRQLDLTNIFLNQTVNGITIGIKSPGLSSDLPFGNSVYDFSIRVTDENGTGESSYALVKIKVNDTNTKGPIPTKFSCILQGINSTIQISFDDYDDPAYDHSIPYRIEIIDSPNFILRGPTLSSIGSFDIVYNGVLTRSSRKNLTATFRSFDKQNISQTTNISIVVCDQPNTFPISDGIKTIQILYVNGYQNSIQNIDLGSIYVQDSNDWFRAERIYSIRDINYQQTFSISQGFLRTSQELKSGLYTIHIDVTKPNVSPSALSTINLEVINVESEYIRQATTIRIQGEYPETIIDPAFNLLNKLRYALASLLSVNSYSIIILSIRPVFQYRSPYDLLQTFDIQKNQALTDVVFYIPGSNKISIERILNENLSKFMTNFQLKVIAVGSKLYNKYICPIGTVCRLTRTIQPKPYAIDTNLTSFVGINILDSADCVNSTYPTDLTDSCLSSSNNNFPDCSSISSRYPGPLGPNCEVLSRIFNENGKGYAIYDSKAFSSFAPTRFSFDFILRSSISNGLILLYGTNSSSTDDFFWIAIELIQSKLKFHFRNTKLFLNDTYLNSSTWYHVECQFIDTTILVSINDCQYLLLINSTLNSYNLSNVHLYLGGLPSNALIYSLYPDITSVDQFNGYIQNVLSNGNYLDMSKSLSSANSDAGVLSCTIRNSCTEQRRLGDIIVPWYTWLIIVLVLLFLLTILIVTLLTCIRRRQLSRIRETVYTDDTRENIIDYKETAGEEDHPTYNLHILKKPIYAISNGNMTPNNDRLGYNGLVMYHRPPLSTFIDEKLTEQTISYPYDTQLHYRYEGEGSMASNLSSIESPSLSDKHDYKFIYSLGPKFSGLANLYADPVDDDDVDT